MPLSFDICLYCTDLALALLLGIYRRKIWRWLILQSEKLYILNDIIVCVVFSIAIWNNTQNEKIQINDDFIEYVESYISQKNYFSLNVRYCFQVFLLTSEKLVWHNKPKVSIVNSRITSTKDILHAKARFHWSNFSKISP